jgi:hypothetical protein
MGAAPRRCRFGGALPNPKSRRSASSSPRSDLISGRWARSARVPSTGDHNPCLESELTDVVLVPRWDIRIFGVNAAVVIAVPILRAVAVAAGPGDGVGHPRRAMCPNRCGRVRWCSRPTAGTRRAAD